MDSRELTLQKIDRIKAEINQTILSNLEEYSGQSDLNLFFQECHKIILSPGAKRLRPIITVLVAEALQLDRQESLQQGILVEMLHFTSLVHDDVIDRDVIRRGQPTLNAVFPVNHAVLLGDFMMGGLINRSLQMKNSIRVTQLLTDGIKQLVTGLLIEQNTLPQRPTLENYREMVAGKTGFLFALSFSFPLLGASEYEKAAQCGHLFGLLYQLYDDYLDRENDECSINIFHIAPQQEIDTLWHDSHNQLTQLSREVGLEPVITDIVTYLRASNYFLRFEGQER